jgi:hypothetical protein
VRDERKLPPVDNDPTRTVSALVMPAPLDLPELVQSRMAVEDGSPIPNIEYPSGGIADSPDDLLAVAYPSLLPRVHAGVAQDLRQFVTEMTARIEQALGNAYLGDLEKGNILQARFGARRIDERGSPVVWVEFYSPEREVYVLPPLSSRGGQAIFLSFESIDEASLEFFDQGPVRMVIEAHAPSEELRAVPWVSSLASEEAESHFVRGVRSPLDGGPSFLASELMQHILGYAVQEGIIDDDAYRGESERFLSALGEGEVLSVSTQTDRSRSYLIRYSLPDKQGDTVPLVCNVSLREHPMWGLRLVKADIRKASDSL